MCFASERSMALLARRRVRPPSFPAKHVKAGEMPDTTHREPSTTGDYRDLAPARGILD